VWQVHALPTGSDGRDAALDTPVLITSARVL
jgi:hypothetical protein